MNTVPMITPRSITGISGLKKRPVYFLKLNGAASPNLVVKGEQYSASIKEERDLEISIAWGSKLMKNVQHSMVNTKIMAPTEIQLFKAAVHAKYTQPDQEFQFAFGGAAYKWVKMPFVAGLSDADVNEERKFKSGDTHYTLDVFTVTKLKEAINKLSDESVWFALGKVVAVDIFNGNNDRFNIKTGSWDNLGNVMFENGSGQMRVIGLDTFSPVSGNAGNLSSGGVYPELLVLNDANKRRNFAELCARGVGTTLKNKLLDVGTRVTAKINGPGGTSVVDISAAKLPEFFLPYAPLFEQGLAHGSYELKQYLQRKVREYNAPVAAAAPAVAAAPRGFLSPQRQAPPRPGALTPAKPIPQGIVNRMNYLGW